MDERVDTAEGGLRGEGGLCTTRKAKEGITDVLRTRTTDGRWFRRWIGFAKVFRTLVHRYVCFFLLPVYLGMVVRFWSG